MKFELKYASIKDSHYHNHKSQNNPKEPRNKSSAFGLNMPCVILIKHRISGELLLSDSQAVANINKPHRTFFFFNIRIRILASA